MLEIAREHRPVPFELAEHVTPEARVRLEEVPHPRVLAFAPPPRSSADEGQVLDRPDEGVPLEELPLLPEQPVELGGVEGAEAAEEDELLRRRDRRDRIHLEEAESANRVEDRGRRAVEQLRADRDAARLLDAQRFGELHRAMLDGPVRRSVLWRPPPSSMLLAIEPNRLITREELVPALFTLHDILEEVRKIRRLLEDDDGEEVQEDLGE